MDLTVKGILTQHWLRQHFSRETHCLFTFRVLFSLPWHCVILNPKMKYMRRKKDINWVWDRLWDKEERRGIKWDENNKKDSRQRSCLCLQRQNACLTDMHCLLQRDLQPRSTDSAILVNKLVYRLSTSRPAFDCQIVKPRNFSLSSLF